MTTGQKALSFFLARYEPTKKYCVVMSLEIIDPADLIDRHIGPLTILFGYENGKYPHGNSLLIRGSNQAVIVDPCLGVVARKERLPLVDAVFHSHTHEDHIAGTHLFRDVPWYAHELDAQGLETIEDLMEIYGLEGATHDAFKEEIETRFFYPHDGSEVTVFRDGDEFDFGGVKLRVLHTPGHTRGHCCFVVSWGDSPEDTLVFLGDIELTGFGPYYGDAWSDLEDFERSIERLRDVDAGWWLTFHHKGLIESRDQFLTMLDKFGAMIMTRESNLLAYIAEPRTMNEIIAHRFVYRPGQTGFMVDEVERRSMGMHLDRLVRAGAVRFENNTYVVQENA